MERVWTQVEGVHVGVQMCVCVCVCVCVWARIWGRDIFRMRVECVHGDAVCV